MDRKDQFRTPQWQMKRIEVLLRDDFTCFKCGRKKDIILNVHHKYYLKNKMIWEYPLNAFETLCEDCHPIGKPNQIMDYKKYEKEAIKSIAEIFTSLPYSRKLSLMLDLLIEKCNV